MGDVAGFGDHHAARDMEPEPLLVLDRAHRRHRLEMPMEGRRAHAGAVGKVLDAEGNFGGLIPVESADEEVQAEDILDRIESRFGAPSDEPSMAQAQN